MDKQKVSQGRQTRSDEITRLKKVFESVQGGVLTNFRGLSVHAMTEMRRRFRDKGVQYEVVKNSLARKAVEGTSYQELEKLLVENTGMAFSTQEPIVAAQAVAEFAKDHELLVIKGGFMEGQVLSSAEVSVTSKLGSKKALLAQLLSAFNGPSVKFVSVLNGVQQKFLGVLVAQADKLEKSQPPAEAPATTQA